jgi:gamma-glutamyltranspeptidase / glutathione hydrolase
LQSRSAAAVRKGIVASSHELASFWGAEMLRRGGNVADAAIATSAMLCVVQNNLCGLGGDLFALVKCTESRVRGVNGSGRAGRRATMDFYRSKGYREIPKRGPLAALTVPGIVHAWGVIAAEYASMELKELLQPAIEYAASGFPLTEKYVDSIRATKESLGDIGGWASVFAPSGVVQRPWTNFKQKDLCSTLRQIAEEGAQTYYGGSLMERIVSGIREGGGILEEEDFEKHKTTWDDPVKTNYRGVDIYETAPNSQAATVLLWLNMLEGYDLKTESRDLNRLLRIYVETGLKAYEERAKHITDPAFHKLPPDFASKKYAERLLSSSTYIPQKVSSITSGGDTTYFSIADREGNCASVIQSNYMGFGSGLVPHGTGFVLQNRGCYFSLDPRHHNALLPGKRTFHTICASMAEKDGRTLFSLGLMGGDIQPQVHVQLMTKILDFGMDPQAAIDAPRWVFPGTIYETPSTLLLEEDLARAAGVFDFKGLQREVLKGYSHQTGHAQAVVINDEDSLIGGADPRGDGAVVGF